MRRLFLVLTVAAMMLLVSALPALAEYDYGDEGEPHEPKCDWRLVPYQPHPWDEQWWEYWCYWPGWGWEYVFWTWA